jgi:hypothetical protein
VRPGERLGRRDPASVASCLEMPRHWFWMQVAIVLAVLAGMVIAITKLA